MITQEFNDKKIFITGSGRGHGETMAKVLASRGAVVVVVDINSDNVSRVVSEIEAEGGSAIGIRLDITNKTAVDTEVAHIIDLIGSIDCLVNNACAPIRRIPLLEISLEEWNQVMSVNLTGAFNCTQAIGRHMINRKSGRIINISSIAASIPAMGFAAYSSTKAGLEALSKVSSGELSKYGVTTVFVRPGVIETPFTKKEHLGNVGVKMRSVIASNRFGESRELAELISFLISDKASYINGGPVPIDGGKYICQF